MRAMLLVMSATTLFVSSMPLPDRAAAIGFAVQRAAANDVVLACGKAHEQSMCFGEVEFLWDERTVMRAALAVRLGHPAIPAPVLPTAA